jgi:hypothetical protein
MAPPPPRGNPRGQQGSARARGGFNQGPSRAPGKNLPPVRDHVTTIGKKRPGFGTSGRQITVITNHFPCVIPESIIHHYDGNDLHVPLTLDRILSLVSPLSRSWYVPGVFFFAILVDETRDTL